MRSFAEGFPQGDGCDGIGNAGRRGPAGGAGARGLLPGAGQAVASAALRRGRGGRGDCRGGGGAGRCATGRPHRRRRGQGLPQGGTALHSFYNLWKAFPNAAKRQVVRGIPQEIIERLAKVGGTSGHAEMVKGYDYDSVCTAIDTELYKLVTFEMLAEAGAFVFVNTMVVGAARDGSRLKGVVVESRSGREAFFAKAFVDCTAYGDLAAYAGAKFSEPNDYAVANSIGLANVNVEKYYEFLRPGRTDRPPEWPRGQAARGLPPRGARDRHGNGHHHRPRQLFHVHQVEPEDAPKSDGPRRCCSCGTGVAKASVPRGRIVPQVRPRLREGVHGQDKP